MFSILKKIFCIFILFFIVNLNLLAQNFDGSAHKDYHKSLGFYDSGNIEEIILLYEADFFQDRKDFIKHKGEMPDSSKFVSKMTNKPGVAVLIDIESYTEDHSYLADVVKLIKSKGGEREYWWYGMVYSPPSKFEWSIEGALKKIDRWKESPLKYEITGLAVPCYTRWNYREAQRSQIKKVFCDLAGIRSMGIIWSSNHGANISGSLRGKPKTVSNFRIETLNNINIWKQVTIWSPPPRYEKEEYKYALEISRLMALQCMDQKNN